MRSTLLAGISLAAALALPGASPAQLIEPIDLLKMGHATPVINIAPSLQLEAITASELLAAGASIFDLGTASPVLDSTLSSGALNPSNLAAQSLGPVTRSVDALWWSWMTRRQFGRIDVQYRFVGANGSSGQLSSVDDPTSFIGVTLEAIAPQIVDRKKKRRLVQGGLNLTLDLDQVRAAGRHTGTLTVIVNNL